MAGPLPLGSPSSTQSVEWNDDTVAPNSDQQFHPPSRTAPAARVSATSDMSSPNTAPVANAPPLIHGSVSPAKYGAPFASQRTPSRTRLIAFRTAAAFGSTPKSRSVPRVKWVAVQASKKGRSSRAHPGR